MLDGKGGKKDDKGRGHRDSIRDKESITAKIKEREVCEMMEESLIPWGERHMFIDGLNSSHPAAYGKIGLRKQWLFLFIIL